MVKILPSAEMTKHLQARPPPIITIDDIIKMRDLELARAIVGKQIKFNDERYNTIMCCDVCNDGALVVNYLLSQVWAFILTKTGYIDEANSVLESLANASKTSEGKFTALSAMDGTVYTHPTIVWALAANNYEIIESLKSLGVYVNDCVTYSMGNPEYSIHSSIMMAIAEERLGRNGMSIIEKIRQRPEYQDGLITHTASIDGRITTNVNSSRNSLLAIALSTKCPDEARELVEKLRPMVRQDGKIKTNLFAQDNNESNYDSHDQALWYMAQKCVGIEDEKAIAPINQELHSLVDQSGPFLLKDIMGITALARQTL